MAQALVCDLCEEAPAEFLVTRTEDGESLTACLPCLGGFALGMVQAAAADLPGAPEPAPDGPSANGTVDEEVVDAGTGEEPKSPATGEEPAPATTAEEDQEAAQAAAD